MPAIGVEVARRYAKVNQVDLVGVVVANHDVVRFHIVVEVV